jgi:ketosteroid isomerase-like protein
MNLEELAQRVQTLEDIESIKKLKARYTSYCDNGYEPDGIASLFTEDAVWDGGVFGRCEGREAIRKFFQGASKMLPFAIHYVMNPIIEVNGNTATGSWYLFQTCTFAEGNQAVWGAARYSEEYVKRGGEWKFKNLKVNSEFWTPYDQGWAKKRFVQEK